MSDHHHPIFARAWASLLGTRTDRRTLLNGLHGRVLEVGAGDGLNFAFYPPAVVTVLAVEPEPRLRALAAARAAGAAVPVDVVDGTAERLPAPDGSVDAVVACLVLCSVADQHAALTEIRRVLAPGGRLCFYEHVVARPGAGATLQRALDRSGVWPTLGAGCHLARDTEAAIGAAGFAITQARRFSVSAIPHLAGVARPR